VQAMLRAHSILPRLVAASIVWLSSSAWAAESPTLDLDYAGDASCPDLAAFSALTQAKLEAAGSTKVSSNRPRALVRLHAEDAGFVGQLELNRPDAGVYSREVRGASCEEVANAVAFVLALALTAQDPPAQPAWEPPSPPVPLATPAPTPPLRSEHALKREPPQRSTAWGFGAGAQLGVRTGLGPTWTAVGAAFVEVRRPSTTPFTLTLRGSFADAQTITRIDRSGTTDLHWWAGRLEVCPVQVSLLAPLSLLPCVGGHVGVLTAAGRPRTGQGHQPSKLWVDAVATLRLELRLVSWLSIQAQGEVLRPVTRYQFTFDDPNPVTTVYQVPALAAASLLGIAAQFP
jgi:hypothetical protein